IIENKGFPTPRPGDFRPRRPRKEPPMRHFRLPLRPLAGLTAVLAVLGAAPAAPAQPDPQDPIGGLRPAPPPPPPPPPSGEAFAFPSVREEVARRQADAPPPLRQLRLALALPLRDWRGARDLAVRKDLGERFTERLRAVLRRAVEEGDVTTQLAGV